MKYTNLKEDVEKYDLFFDYEEYLKELENNDIMVQIEEYTSIDEIIKVCKHMLCVMKDDCYYYDKDAFKYCLKTIIEYDKKIHKWYIDEEEGE